MTKFNSAIETFGELGKTMLNSLPPSIMIQAKSEIFNILTKYELGNAEINSSSTPGTEESTPIYLPASTVSSHDQS